MCAVFRAGMVSLSIEPGQLQFLEDIIVDAVLTVQPIPDATTRVIVVEESWFNASSDTAVNPVAVRPNGDSLCRLIFSSGTTGRPKIIGLSFAAADERLISYMIRVGTPSWDRLVCLPGLSTNYGFSFTMTTLWLGHSICFAADTAKARQIILAHQADVLVASTHQISTLVQEQEQLFLHLESLRSVHIGGSIPYAPLLARIRLLVCSNVFCGYGSTEGGTVAYAPAEAIYGMDRAVGIVAPWIDLEVLDNENKVQEYGVEGQIRLRALGQGYRYKKTSKTQYEVDDAEWFYPGDQGILYRNGLLGVTGRINEIINRGGVKVSPDSIEEAIKKNPIVADAAAVGMLDNFGIEQIWVAVTTKDSIELNISKMYEYCRENIPAYIPDRVFQIPSVPRNQLGKVSREELKEQLKTMEKNLVLTVR
jgi:acyl-coenzyme A synthetase/AMP-(fatty) acid ligase